MTKFQLMTALFAPGDSPANVLTWNGNTFSGNRIDIFSCPDGLTLPEILIRQWFAAQQQNQTQTQPLYQHAFFSPAVVTTVTGQFFVPLQVDSGTSQIQPRFWQAQPGNLSPIIGQWRSSAQSDPSQEQPRIWTVQFPNVAAPPIQWFATPQGDPTQIQPLFWRAFFQRVLETPATRQFFVPPQVDPYTSQIQPKYVRIAVIPSTAPPVVTWRIFIINE